MNTKALFYYTKDQYPQIILYNKNNFLHIKRIFKKIYKNKALTIALTTHAISFMFLKR